MSDIEPVSADLWRNPDVVNRVPVGTIPIGDYDLDEVVGGRKAGLEAFLPDAEPYAYWGDTEIPPAKTGRRGRPKGSKNKVSE